MGYSLWMIQFIGRWAASSVLGYVEEAMAEVTATWGSSAPKTPGLPGITAPGTPATGGPPPGADGGVS
eukprot:13086702-Heterocapsa_arctica.AAC.1